jgi:hypothetical protein
MELDYIARHAQAARTFEHAVGGCMFTLRVPTKLESAIAWAQANTAAERDGSAGVRFERALAQVAVAGWAGVLVRHVLPEHKGDEPFAFEPGAASVLWDAQPEWEHSVLQAVLERVSARQAVEDTAEKN